VSIGTLGLIGIGAGVGYGVGTWISGKYRAKKDARDASLNGRQPQQGEQQLELPWEYQVSLQAWQSFLSSRAANGQVPPPEVERAFRDFQQCEPGHAANVASLCLGMSLPSPEQLKTSTG
ncbi:unnamed protein product, partial [Polarella glacialis]